MFSGAFEPTRDGQSLKNGSHGLILTVFLVQKSFQEATYAKYPQYEDVNGSCYIFCVFFFSSVEFPDHSRVVSGWCGAGSVSMEMFLQKER